jgi:hypothetical protein
MKDEELTDEEKNMTDEERANERFCGEFIVTSSKPVPLSKKHFEGLK